MKRNITLILLVFLFANSYGQIGYLGKRDVVSTDLFSDVYLGKYNLDYDFCLGKSFMIKTSYALHNYTTKSILEDGYGYYGNNNFSKNTLKGHSWELGFDYGYFLFTNMPMPIGYYFGMSFEHFSGTINEVHNYFSPTSIQKLKFNNKANIVKIEYGRNTYIRYNIILKTAIDIGMYFGSAIASDSVSMSNSPSMVMPFTNPIKSFRIRYGDSGFMNNNNTTIALYVMPKISIGYIF